ncbi:uncharacterized protein LOC119980755 [Tripterygium wilfordii]|uniref:uncharacterized protein LOC119980755 n=1 Tax=Tripterygium wilfordii TaxID=458696 RepID=UPI0018F85154|nr:uncharacterized protein LOC119980755 [Tripterygium wilfordii]
MVKSAGCCCSGKGIVVDPAGVTGVLMMKAYLMAHDLWRVVQEGYVETKLLDNATIAQIKSHTDVYTKNFQALNFIHSAIHKTIFPRLVGANTAKAAWDMLQEEFQGSTRVRQQRLLTLKREFEMLKMKGSDSLKDYSNEVYGEDVKDHKVVEKILISLPKRFKAKVSAIEESYDLSQLTITELCSKLQAHKQRNSFRNEDVTEGAFQARHKGKQTSASKDGKKKFNEKGWKGKAAEGASSDDSGKEKKFPPCPHCGKTNHPEKTWWEKYGKPQIQCRFCKKFGHIETFCKQKQNSGQSENSSQRANFSNDQQKQQ